MPPCCYRSRHLDQPQMVSFTLEVLSGICCSCSLSTKYYKQLHGFFFVFYFTDAQLYSVCHDHETIKEKFWVIHNYGNNFLNFYGGSKPLFTITEILWAVWLALHHHQVLLPSRGGSPYPWSIRGTYTVYGLRQCMVWDAHVISSYCGPPYGSNHVWRHLNRLNAKWNLFVIFVTL